MSTDQPSPGAVESQLRRVLDSETFHGAERARALLRFVVEETLQGRSDQLKEYTLGSQALGRGEGFDPRSDPIARVEASRLRSRLDIYYATEGVSDPIRISLPKGGMRLPSNRVRSTRGHTSSGCRESRRRPRLREASRADGLLAPSSEVPSASR